MGCTVSALDAEADLARWILAHWILAHWILAHRDLWRIGSWRVESRRAARCLREQGSGSARRAAARRCWGQDGHRLQSRGVVRSLPAPMPWALLRPPFVRPRTPR